MHEDRQFEMTFAIDHLLIGENSCRTKRQPLFTANFEKIQLRI